MRRLPPLILALAMLLLAAPRAAAAPNVVVIETDDQTAADLASMPRTRALIGDEGVTFSRSIVSLSECCPSRATLLTGQYAHNHGVLSSRPPFGGFELLDSHETLASWLQRAGYATALVGKYLNGYGVSYPLEVPPGWTEWHGLLNRWTYRFRRYTFNHDGVLQPEEGAYQSDAVTALSEDIVRRRAPAEAPFFLWTNYVAPHHGGPAEPGDPRRVPTTVPAPRHRGAFAGVAHPHSAAFDEADVSDKPSWIRGRPRLTASQVTALQEAWQQRQESLLAVDEGVERIVGALRQTGELDRTLLIFTSDNGFVIGEHRKMSGKRLAYEPAIRVPLLMRGPGVPVGHTRSQLVWNGDIAPTIAEAAGATAPWAFDGLSLWPFVRDRAARSRRDVLLEASPGVGTHGRPRYLGVRTPRYAYVEHDGGEEELYDLAWDPDQLQNLAGTRGTANLQAELAQRLAWLRHCTGAECRARGPAKR
jgi:N-acetylglucosamine-6-sulfatase